MLDNILLGFALWYNFIYYPLCDLTWSKAVNPPRHQIIKLLRIQREGMIDDVISHDMTSLEPKMLVDSDQRI